ncbi:MAG TPA: hypothetical protein VG673_01495 [Actinomycetota bacterium]|nr:hypothetical protein [Actinomycetota bacterium]
MHGLPPAELERTLETGILTGLAAGVPTGLFMMLASASWGQAGAFTPFYRIAAVLDRAAFDISLEQAATGSRFWFEPQTALPGVCVHLALAAVFGVVFVLLAHEGRGARPLALLLAGAAWGVVVAAVMVPVLRLAGRSVGGGDLVAEVPGQLGWPTYLGMHLVYGLALGAVVALRAARRRA